MSLDQLVESMYQRSVKPVDPSQQKHENRSTEFETISNVQNTNDKKGFGYLLIRILKSFFSRLNRYVELDSASTQIPNQGSPDVIGVRDDKQKRRVTLPAPLKAVLKPFRIVFKPITVMLTPIKSGLKLFQNLLPSSWVKKMRLQNKLMYYTILLVIFGVFGGLAYFSFFHPKEILAAWFNDNWLYRKEIPISSHTSAETRVYISATLDTSDSVRFQADCGDLRFTDAAGNLLQYYIASGCGTASTVVHVYLEDFPAGAQSLYYYYGNPSAPNGFATTDFSPEATSYALGTMGSEEQSPGPIVYYPLDEGTGSITNNATQYASSSGSLNADITGATWTKEDQCIIQKCLAFDGLEDAATSSANLNLSRTFAVTVSFWLKIPSKATSEDQTIEFSNNFNNSTTGFSYIHRLASTGLSQACVRGNVGTNCSEFSRITENEWHHIEVVFDKSQAAATEVTPYIDGRAVSYSKSNSNNNTNQFGVEKLYLMHRGSSTTLNQQGYMDDLKIYPYARSAAQVQADFASRGGYKGTNNVLGAQDMSFLSKGLVGYWKMDETSANTCSNGANDSCDSSGNGFDGAWNGNATASNSAKFGAGTTYDGSGDYTQVTRNTTLEPASQLTLSLWFKTTSANNGRLVSIGTSNVGYELIATSSDYLQFNLTLDDTGNFYNTNSATGHFDGQWHQVVATFDGNKMRLYVDGVLENSKTVTGSSIFYNNRDLYFGRLGTAASQFYNGVLDEARLYNRALSPDEVISLYNFAPGPVGYWDFEEGQGGVIDKSGNNNTGTWNGTGTKHWTNGKYGKAGNFNGTDDYVESGTFASGDTGGNISMMGWVNIQDSASTDQYIYHKTSKLDLRIRFETDVVCTIRASGASSIHIFDTNFPFTNGWHHVACVYDGQNATVYIDGIKRVSAVQAGALDSGSGNLRIGEINPTGSPWKGKLDELKIYNYARSQKQIVEDMNANHRTVGSPVGSAIGHWDFDDGYGTVASDSSQMKRHGSIYRALWTNDSKFGKALQFDGTSYVQLGNVPEYKIETKSITFWAKPGHTPSATEGIVAAGSDANWYTGITTSSGPKMILSYENSAGSQKTVNSTSNIDVTNWHHYAYTFSVDQSSNVILKMYIDGKLDKTTTNTDGYGGGYGTNFLLGAFGVSGSNNYIGLLDEVKVYNYELTLAEVKLDMNQGKSLVLGSFGMDSSGIASNAAQATYCVPGDTTQTCAPVGEWRFEEGYGKNANDTSGNGANTSIEPSLSTITWTSGKVGSALNWDTTGGGSPSVSAGNPSQLNITGAVSVSTWARLGRDGATRGLVTKGQAINNAAINYMLVMDSNDVMRFQVSDGTNFNVSGPDLTTDRNWHHFVGVYEPSTALRIYMDGKLYASNTTSIPASISTDSNNFVIGNVGALSQRWHGDIDEVKVYNYALSPAQVAWDYNRGKPIAYYDFDDCQGSVIHEYYNSSNSATLRLGGSGTTSIGTCTTSSTAWGNGVTGKFNSSIDLDGTDDSITFPPYFSFWYNQMTWSMWVKFGTVQSVGIMEMGNGSNGAWFGTASSSRFSLGFPGDDNVHSVFRPVAGQWYHVVYVRDTSASGANKSRIFVNGKEPGYFYNPGVVGLTATGGARIGTSLDSGTFGPGVYFDGQVDDIQIFNYNLTPVQIRNLYNQSAAVRFGPLQGSP